MISDKNIGDIYYLHSIKMGTWWAPRKKFIRIRDVDDIHIRYEYLDNKGDTDWAHLPLDRLNLTRFSVINDLILI